MKIFYEEGRYWDEDMYDRPNKTMYINDNVGYKFTMEIFGLFTRNYDVDKVYTSCLWLLNCSEDNDVYIWHKQKMKYIHVSELTDKEIKPAHNIEMMYRNGAFDKELEWREDK